MHQIVPTRRGQHHEPNPLIRHRALVGSLCGSRVCLLMVAHPGGGGHAGRRPLYRGTGGPRAQQRQAGCPRPAPTDRQVASVVEVVRGCPPAAHHGSRGRGCGTTVGLGAPAPTARELSAWTDPALFFLIALLVPLLFGPWEEPGFRGFALSKLMQTRSVLAASVMVAVIIVFWHLPLFVLGDIPPADVLLILAAGIVFGALVVGSGGSVLLAMIMHATNNAVSGEYISQMFSGQDAATLGWIRAGIWCLFAVAALIIGGRRFWTQAPQETATPVAPVDART